VARPPGHTRQHRKTAQRSPIDTISQNKQPRATTRPDGTATSYLAAEVQSSSPRRPREGRSQSQIQLNSSRNAIPAANSRGIQRGDRPRRRGFSPRPRSRFSRATSQPAVSRSRCRSTRAPKPNAPGHDLDPRRRHPTRAPAHEDPLPGGPPNLYLSNRAVAS